MLGCRVESVDDHVGCEGEDGCDGRVVAAEDGDVKFFVGFGWFSCCCGGWWWRLLGGVGVVICVIHGVVVGDGYLLRKGHGELCKVLGVVVEVYEIREVVIVVLVLVLVVIMVICSTASSLTRGHGVCKCAQELLSTAIWVLYTARL